MPKKITAGALFIMMLMSLLSIGAAAEPYTEINITADEISYIEAVYFDTEPYNETNLAEVQHGAREHDIQTEVILSEFEGNICYTAAGEWVQYTVNVMVSGNYKFDAYLASGSTIAAGNITLLYNDTEIGTTASEDVFGWTKYEWYEVGSIDMTAGTHVIRLDFVDGNTNIAAIRVTPVNITEAEEPESETEAPEPETTPEPETEAPAPADEAETDTTTSVASDEADTTTTTAPADSDEDNNMMLWIIVGAAAVVIIVVIIVIATKEKK